MTRCEHQAAQAVDGPELGHRRDQVLHFGQQLSISRYLIWA